jgi:hypothetical protein
MEVNNMAHSWTDDDDRKALDCYLNGYSKYNCDIVARRLGIGENSFWLRIQNFKYLATNGVTGMSNYSLQTQRIYNEYKKATN